MGEPRAERSRNPARLFATALGGMGKKPVRPTPTGPAAQLAGQKRTISPPRQTGEDAYMKRRGMGDGPIPTGPRLDGFERLEGGSARESKPPVDEPQGSKGQSLLDRMGGPPLNPQAPSFGPGQPFVPPNNGFAPLPGRGRGGYRGGNSRARMHGGRPLPHMHQQNQMMDPFMMGMMGMPGFNPAPGSTEAMIMQDIYQQNQAALEQMQAMMYQMYQSMVSFITSSLIGPLAFPTHLTCDSQGKGKFRQGGQGSKPVRKSATLVNNIASTSTGQPPTAAKATSKNNLTLINPPEKPPSQEICKYGVGCSHRTCQYSHPSPVATQESGVVLRTDACPDMLECKNKDCPFSHVSPSIINGHATSGQVRVPCRFGDKCNNSACPYRHEDAAGNWIPAPALTRRSEGTKDVDMTADSAAHDDLDITLTDGNGQVGANGMAVDSTAAGKAKLDVPLGSSSSSHSNTQTPYKPNNGQIKAPCRFGQGCTNPTCRFQHGRGPCRYGKKCFDGMLLPFCFHTHTLFLSCI